MLKVIREAFPDGSASLVVAVTNGAFIAGDVDDKKGVGAIELSRLIGPADALDGLRRPFKGLKISKELAIERSSDE